MFEEKSRRYSNYGTHSDSYLLMKRICSVYADLQIEGCDERLDVSQLREILPR